MMQPTPDDLATRATSDPAAFLQLYDAYFQRVYNYIYYRCADRCLAEDLTARVFERLLAHIGQFTPERGIFEAWLFAIVRNVVNDHYRRSRFPWFPLDLLRKQPAPDPSVEEKVVRREVIAELGSALQKLDPHSLDLVSMKFFARLNNRQIAEITDMSESAVGVALFRAVAKLRGWLADETAEDPQHGPGKEMSDERG
jgi:RNA polymerase sigma-70 factor (ECF subfamily)